MSNNNIFLIGTRGSRLALTQAEMIRKKISEVLKLETCVLKTIQTQGDKATHETPLVENKVLLPGIFTRELDSALLAGKIDAAVHSLKDVPTELPINIQYGFFDLREDHHDVLISFSENSLFFLINLLTSIALMSSNFLKNDLMVGTNCKLFIHTFNFLISKSSISSATTIHF